MDEPGANAPHHQGISTRMVFAALVLISILIFGVALFNLTNIVSDFTRLKQKEHVRTQSEEAIQLIMEGSDVLTDRAYAFASTGNIAYLTQYWKEVNVSRKREHGLVTLESMNLPEEDLRHAREAIAESERLMGREIRAMRLVCDSLGMSESDMPEPVARYLLAEKDHLLTPKQKRQQALNELYSGNYYSQKQLIVNSVNTVRKRTVERNAKLMQETTSALNRQINLGLFCLSMILVLFFAALALYYFFVFLPTDRYTKRMSQWKKDLSELDLAPQGMQELRQFATGFNALSANLRRAQDELRLNEEQYRVVALQSERYIFRYDIATKVLEKSAATAGKLRFIERLENIPESNIVRGAVAPGSQTVYRELFAAMARGEETGSATVNLRVRSTGEWRWFNMTFTTMFGANHVPVYGVISLEDVTERREKEIAYEKWQREIDALKTQNSAVYEYNLTRGILEKRVEAAHPIFPLSDQNLEKQIQQYATLVHAEDRANFEQAFSRERLLGAYYGGRTELSFDFRLNAGERDVWHNARIQMVPYPNSSEIKAYVILKDVDAQRRNEIAVQVRAQIDGLTGVLNRRAFIETVETLFQQEPAGTHALLMIDLDGFKQVNDALGHSAGDRMLIHVAQMLKSTLRTGDLLGRIGGDEFIVCLKNVSSQDAIHKRVDSLRTRVHTPMTDGNAVTASVGVAMYPDNGKSFDMLYRCADAAMYRAKAGGRNRISFFTPDMLLDPRETKVSPIDELFEEPME